MPAAPLRTTLAHAGPWAVPLRVNLRYSPSGARVRLTGELQERHAGELVRVLELLAGLPAPVHVDVTGLDGVDGPGWAILQADIDRRLARSLPPLTVDPPLPQLAPGRFVRTGETLPGRDDVVTAHTAEAARLGLPAGWGRTPV